ncbi:unnamed protein product [Trifolium pratense]|uniref:Uncharacterized protein n=1 Tax=Trifolium pratense TaxID=57577 RepID=A0ACB0JCQ7_TRIPR|nr:unnamed protein product [Trifolium pratense]
MATSDLLNELTKPTFMTDPDLEFKLKIINIQQLDDAAGDVSGLAVKCLTPLARKMNGSNCWSRAYILNLSGYKFSCVFTSKSVILCPQLAT